MNLSLSKSVGNCNLLLYYGLDASQVMGSLGPQLDSAIEAAIRMLEGTTDAVRHGCLFVCVCFFIKFCGGNKIEGNTYAGMLMKNTS